jgi:hypothetical protein
MKDAPIPFLSDSDFNGLVVPAHEKKGPKLWLVIWNDFQSRSKFWNVSAQTYWLW